MTPGTPTPGAANVALMTQATTNRKNLMLMADITVALDLPSKDRAFIYCRDKVQELWTDSSYSIKLNRLIGIENSSPIIFPMSQEIICVYVTVIILKRRMMLL